MSQYAVLIEQPTYDALLGATEQVAHSGKLPLVLLGEQTPLDIARLREILCSHRITFAGGIVPGVIYASDVYPSAALVCAFPCEHEPLVVSAIGSAQPPLPGKIMQWAGQPDVSRDAALLILVDGYAAGIGRFLVELSGFVGPRVICFGGGAGFSDLVQRPCLFTNAGVFANAAILVPLRTRVNCAVRHGWVRIGEPLIATRTSGHILRELNWRPAFEVYRDALLSACGTTITRDNFPVLAREHPLGILREGGENLIRDPIAVELDGSLVCVGEVPENATLTLMQGHAEALIEASAQAAREATQAVSGKGVLVWAADCVSRLIFLGEKFKDELCAAYGETQARCPGAEFCGFLSFGEIASSPSGRALFHNKTVVSAVLYEQE